MWDKSSAADECNSILSFDGSVGDGATAGGGSALAVCRTTCTKETFFLGARSATASWSGCIAAKDDRVAAKNPSVAFSKAAEAALKKQNARMQECELARTVTRHAKQKQEEDTQRQGGQGKCTDGLHLQQTKRTLV